MGERIGQEQRKQDPSMPQTQEAAQDAGATGVQIIPGVGNGPSASQQAYGDVNNAAAQTQDAGPAPAAQAPSGIAGAAAAAAAGASAVQPQSAPAAHPQTQSQPGLAPGADPGLAGMAHPPIHPPAAVDAAGAPIVSTAQTSAHSPSPTSPSTSGPGAAAAPSQTNVLVLAP